MISTIQRLIDDECDLFAREIDGDKESTRDDLMSKIQEIVDELKDKIEIELANELESVVDDHFDEECVECDGTGKCSTCEGTGDCKERVFVNGGLEAHLDDCDACGGDRECCECDGTGECPHCEGSGKQYQE